MTDEELKAYIANAEKKSRETGLPIMRKDTAMAPAYLPEQEASLLPTIGAIGGGLAGGLLIKNPMAGARAGQAFVGSLVPSLVGSTAGTVAGTVAERAIQGDLLSSEGGKQLLGNMVENAAWDVGGNLVFGLAGKTIRIGKDALAKAGIVQQGAFSSPQEARVAAQKFLAERGASLSAGQLEGTPLQRMYEGIVKGGTGSAPFARQQEKVSAAVQQGLDDVRNSLQTSEVFQQQLKADRPLDPTVGTNFQDLLASARESFKSTYRPFYENLSKETGIQGDLRGVKKQAKEELDRITRSKVSSERQAVLEDIVKQPDFVDFGTLHDIRSTFGEAANDLAIPGKAATSKQAAYSKYAAELEKVMDTAVERGSQGVFYGQGTLGVSKGTPLSKDFIQQYQTTKEAYKAGMNGLFNETINQAMATNPSKVGSILADLTQTEKFNDLFSAVQQIQRYTKNGGEEASKMIGDIKYRFLESTLQTPEQAVKFASQLKDNNELRRSFYSMFQKEAKPLQDVLNAAHIGLDDTSTMSSYLKTRTAATGYQAATGVFGYLALPSSVQERLKENLPEAATTGGVLLLTPYVLARASTSPELVNALAGLSKYKEGTKISGAMSAKLASELEKSGIIDSEYINTVNSVFNVPKQQEQTTPSSLTDDALMQYIQQQK